MDRPTITIGDKTFEMKTIDGRAFRLVSEYKESDFKFSNSAMVEEAAEFIAKFFDGVTADDVLYLPLEEIMPLAFRIERFVINLVSGKSEKIAKNADEGKALSA